MSKWTFYLSSDDQLVRKMIVKQGHTLTLDPAKADVVVFTGGADVTPLLYGERKHAKTYCHIPRDQAEVKLFRKLPVYTPKIGICRGAQFLNVMCGGRLWQDVDNHAIHGKHDVYFNDSKTIRRCSSTHHQMMIPGEEAFVVASARESSKKENFTDGVWTGETDPMKRDWDDPEVVYYWHGNALCWQPHPEKEDKDDQEFFFEMVETYLFSTKSSKC